LGIGGGRNDQSDTHTEGLAMDFHGAVTSAGHFDVLRDWGNQRVPAAIGGDKFGRWPDSASRTSYRLATDPMDLAKVILGAARAPRFFEMLPEPLQKWDIISPPEPTENIFPTYEEDDLILTSKCIDLNVLSIDEERVIVNALFPDLIKTLEKHGFTPIPVRHRHRRLFGGGFHCFTLDTVRQGSSEDYFW